MRRTLGRIRLQLARDAKPAIATAVLVVAGFVAALVLVASLHVRLPWQHRYVTKVAVRDAAGIVPHSAVVRISGVPVGRVTNVDIEDRRPVLTIEMEPGRGPLYRDARAQIRPGTPLNDRFLDVIDRGTKRAGVLGRNDVLDASRTSQPVDLSEVLNLFDARVRPRMRAAIVELGRALDDHGEDFQRTLVELTPFLRAARRMSDQVATRSDRVRRLVHNLALMSGEVGRRDAQLSRLMASAGDTFDELGDRSSPLAQLLVELPRTLRDVPPTFATLRRTVDHVDPTLEALRPTARALPRGLAALDRLSPGIRASMNNLDTAMRPLHRLMGSSRPVARDLDAALRKLEPQVRRADVMNQRAKPCQGALAAYLARWLSVYKLYDDSTVLTHGQANYPPSSAAGTADPALSAPKSCTGTKTP